MMLRQQGEWGKGLPVGCVNMDIMGLSSWYMGAGNQTEEFKEEEQIKEWHSLKNYAVWGSLQDN